MDTIIIEQLQINAIIGVLPHERTHPQPVVITIHIGTETRDAAQSQDLTSTINYAEVASRAEQIAVDGKFLLVEALAERIAEDVLNDPRAARVMVQIAKPDALAAAVSVGVRITRQRT